MEHGDSAEESVELGHYNNSNTSSSLYAPALRALIDEVHRKLAVLDETSARYNVLFRDLHAKLRQKNAEKRRAVQREVGSDLLTPSKGAAALLSSPLQSHSANDDSVEVRELQRDNEALQQQLQKEALKTREAQRVSDDLLKLKEEYEKLRSQSQADKQRIAQLQQQVQRLQRQRQTEAAPALRVNDGAGAEPGMSEREKKLEEELKLQKNLSADLRKELHDRARSAFENGTAGGGGGAGGGGVTFVEGPSELVLQRELKLKEENASLRTEVNVLQERNRALTEKWNEARKEHDRLQGELEDKEHQITKMALQLTQSDVPPPTDDEVRLATKFSKLDSKADKLEADMELMEENFMLRSQVAELEEKLAALGK